MPKVLHIIKRFIEAMYIAKGPDEDLRPINVGLLFFSKSPEKFSLAHGLNWCGIKMGRDNGLKSIISKAAYKIS